MHAFRLRNLLVHRSILTMTWWLLDHPCTVQLLIDNNYHNCTTFCIKNGLQFNASGNIYMNCFSFLAAGSVRR